MSALRKATRQKTKLRLGLSAVSGGGKTVSALRMAYGITGNWDKIAIIDTENGSADLYANHKLKDGFLIGEFNTLPLSAPFAPEKYVEAIKDCEAAGMEVIIVDSITHEWEYILEEHGAMQGNSFTNWAKFTPRHNNFIQAMLQSQSHIITTVRRKQDYALSTNDKGKITPEKVGTKEITRDGFEYELTLNLELDVRHYATVLKDRTGLLDGKPSFMITEATGAIIKDWCDNGLDVEAEVKEAIAKLEMCDSVEELKTLKSMLPEYVINDLSFKAAGNARYTELTAHIL